MLEKLKDLSRVIIIPAIVLYALGFVCITGYLARFGIVSFDIINARYLAAGFLPLVGFVAAAMLAIFFVNTVSKFEIFGHTAVRTWRERYGFYAKFLLWSWSVAIVINGVLRLGAITVAPTDRSLTFAPLTSRDLVGEFVGALPLDWLEEDLAFILRVSLETLTYGVLLTAIGWAGIELYARVRAHWRSATPQPTRALPPTSQSVGESETTIQKPVSRIQATVITFCDGAWLALGAGLLLWSGLKLSKATVDFSYLPTSDDLSVSLVYAWIAGSMLACMIAINWLKPRQEQLSLNFLASLSHPGVFSDAFQLMVLPLVLSLFTFGATVFPRVPFAIGGGEPRKVVVMLKSESTTFRGHELYLIGESGQFFFLVDPLGGGGAFQVNKDEIEYIETRQIPIASDTQKSEAPKASEPSVQPTPSPPQMWGGHSPI